MVSTSVITPWRKHDHRNLRPSASTFGERIVVVERGRTTVLGRLRDVVEDLGEIGMQVHRSHWVAHAHVRRIVGTAGDAACVLSNELRVPVSRRRWKEVREQYGRGVLAAPGATQEIVMNKPLQRRG